MEFLEADHPEWLQMWQELAKQRINEGDAICLFENHCWEYLGSNHDHHHFCHRCHPRTGRTEFAYIERRCAGVNWARSA
ncbi:hypothetical protein P886_2855 [Alteromonadaceae bacterium 2753L.S.0a.02]|nr:hypothetical protein P886_2855 [Alteromonadaceae bacterium 2753L.S.0a.02]